tara:strand:+ start:2044 stop:4083 length:2040 start_codon:yes stop_codon:yes gene_type:complete
MRVLILTSCTGEKSLSFKQSPNYLDFKKGPEHLKKLEKTNSTFLTPAKNLYTGQQHIRLLKGINKFQNSKIKKDQLNLYILSAGYGLIPSNRKILPYECTFHGMKKKERTEWANKLKIPNKSKNLLSKPYDLGMILLGDSYHEACTWSSTLSLGGPTLFFCGKKIASKLPDIKNLIKIVLSNQEAKKFSCGLVGLKGEVASLILEKLLKDPKFINRLKEKNFDISNLAHEKTIVVNSFSRIDTKSNVDYVIKISKPWLEKPHKKKLKYFIPEWDDLVDPEYNFLSDIHSGGTGDWSNEVYSHQMYSSPNYDGILVSKVVSEKSKKKKDRINSLGVHRFLRVPKEFEVMGDCGAFGYINEQDPPYTISEIIDYYSRLGFNFGVSLDHLIVKATEEQKKYRYELTINNAFEFLKEHKMGGHSWVPIGAVQGWDPTSYAKAARRIIKMGYKYIGLGGLVRSPTKLILATLEEVYKEVKGKAFIHLFGLARLNAIQLFNKYGVRSVDSASFLRRAWLGAGQNYFTESGEFYSAIRIPQGGKSFRAKRMVSEGRATSVLVDKLEAKCLKLLRDYDKEKASLENTLDVILEYDNLITPNRSNYDKVLRKVLEAKPWKHCQCAICKEIGVDVIIFRGNNRNRRRGFHNTFVFYKILEKILNGDNNGVNLKTINSQQLSLFDPVKPT